MMHYSEAMTTTRTPKLTTREAIRESAKAAGLVLNEGREFVRYIDTFTRPGSSYIEVSVTYNIRGGVASAWHRAESIGTADRAKAVTVHAWLEGIRAERQDPGVQTDSRTAVSTDGGAIRPTLAEAIQNANLPAGWIKRTDGRGDYFQCTVGRVGTVDVATEGVYVTLYGEKVDDPERVFALGYTITQAAELLARIR